MTEKIYSFLGVSIFCLYVCYVVIKNKLFSKTSKILLCCGVLSFIDIPFTILVIEALIGEIIAVYLFWLGTFIFIIVAKLTKINLEAISGVYEVMIFISRWTSIIFNRDRRVRP
ncbi:MAG: hypothetical protein ACTSQI_22600 [Candidatus Helarchaeota archaeon]